MSWFILISVLTIYIYVYVSIVLSGIVVYKETLNKQETNLSYIHPADPPSDRAQNVYEEIYLQPTKQPVDMAPTEEIVLPVRKSMNFAIVYSI